MRKAARVSITCFHDSLPAQANEFAVVVVDVIRATTTAITAVAGHHRCVVANSLESAFALRRNLPGALLVGEIGGEMPVGFDLPNSPAALARAVQDRSPIILLSSSGTRLMVAAACLSTVYVAALRNFAAQVATLLQAPQDVLLVGAGTRGEFRPEDQLCCAWMASALLSAGYEADEQTLQMAERWSDVDAEAIRTSNSAAYLLSSGQQDDLEFVLSHVGDVNQTFVLRGGEVLAMPGVGLQTCVA